MFVKRGRRDRSNPNFESVGGRFAVVCVVLIVPKMAELVFRAGSGSRRFGLLHRQSAHD